ncbi:bifunctional riboflavin kinase/FAD synthetase [Candidatus Pantoea edessiphila]|uniref:Riboflavin biosynthesis protein n=1 Tax=Candidatus Pantoea edessiphila TaxID=2044610 RepID=A0A2P5SW90_9GAMM|nr:bifunctional riboflavin kinase/FAD synthetase [Candidatus Pantoea edessiphila]PPI86580.1 bifunctional riboflavin kinase/FMN adenylyltransferase [Candidatus Pantoea edessiphila]
MHLIRGIHNIKKHHHGCVLTIGNFDGVHKGHQTLLVKLRQEALKYKLPMMVMLFEPQTIELFAKKNTPITRLTSLREKLRYLSEAGVDNVLCARFNYDFAKMSANCFISELLVSKLGVKYLAIGSDFRFGSGGQGNISLLKKAGNKYNFNVTIVKTLHDGMTRISSTSIRYALTTGNLKLAESLLGHPFIISGKVIHGNSLGKVLGFPTANVNLNRKIYPINGIYVVKVYGLSLKPMFGVANIGTRPTLKDYYYQLEVHLFDIKLNLYGKRIDVMLIHKLRDEKCFISLEDLKKQIAKDIIAAKKFFSLTS